MENIMNDLTNRLNNIIVCANEIKKEIDDCWYDLFLKDDAKNSYITFTMELENIHRDLGNIRDVIYETLYGDE